MKATFKLDLELTFQRFIKTLKPPQQSVVKKAFDLYGAEKTLEFFGQSFKKLMNWSSDDKNRYNELFAALAADELVVSPSSMFHGVFFFSDEKKQKSAFLKEVSKRYNIDTIHKRQNLVYEPYKDISSANQEAVKIIHQSAGLYRLGRKRGQGSKYYLGLNKKGEAVYIRIANHWGNFSTSKDGMGGGITNYNWELKGISKPGNKSRAGYLIISDLF